MRTPMHDPARKNHTHQCSISRFAVVTDPELETRLSGDIAQHGSEQKYERQRHRAAFSIVASSSRLILFVSREQARRCPYALRLIHFRFPALEPIGMTRWRITRRRYPRPMMRLRAPIAPMTFLYGH